MSAPLIQPSPQRGEGYSSLLLAPLGGRGRVRGAWPRLRLAGEATSRRFAPPLTGPSPEGESSKLLLLSPLGRGRVRGLPRS